MPQRRLPAVRTVPWTEFRRHATTAFLMLQAGWSALTPAEREEARRLIAKSKGRPRNLARGEAQRLGRIAAKAATGASSARSRRSR